MPSANTRSSPRPAVFDHDFAIDDHRFDIRRKDRIDNLFTAWWVEALRLLNQRVMRLRTGKINHYVLFALAFLALVFLLSIFNLIG